MKLIPIILIVISLNSCYITQYRMKDICYPVGEVIYVEERGGKCFVAVEFPNYIQGPAQAHHGIEPERICFQDVRCEAEKGDLVTIFYSKKK